MFRQPGGANRSRIDDIKDALERHNPGIVNTLYEEELEKANARAKKKVESSEADNFQEELHRRFHEEMGKVSSNMEAQIRLRQRYLEAGMDPNYTPHDLVIVLAEERQKAKSKVDQRIMEAWSPIQQKIDREIAELKRTISPQNYAKLAAEIRKVERKYGL